MIEGCQERKDGWQKMRGEEKTTVMRGTELVGNKKNALKRRGKQASHTDIHGHTV